MVEAPRGRWPPRRAALGRVLDRAQVEAAVREEVDVLGDQHRALDVRRDRVIGDANPRHLARPSRSRALAR